MKKTYAIALSMLLVAASVCFSTILASASQEAGAKTYQAKVVNVDAAKNELSVKDSKGADVILRITGTTKMTKGGKEGTLTDIKAGEKVSNELEGTGENATVKTIVISPAKSAGS